jgi:hypothetical protein
VTRRRIYSANAREKFSPRHVSQVSPLPESLRHDGGWQLPSPLWDGSKFKTQPQRCQPGPGNVCS